MATEIGSGQVNPHVVLQVVVIEYTDHLRALSVRSCQRLFATAFVVVRGRDQHESSRFGFKYVGDNSAMAVNERVEAAMEDDDLLKIVIHCSCSWLGLCTFMHMLVLSIHHCLLSFPFPIFLSFPISVFQNGNWKMNNGKWKIKNGSSNWTFVVPDPDLTLINWEIRSLDLCST